MNLIRSLVLLLLTSRISCGSFRGSDYHLRLGAKGGQANFAGLAGGPAFKEEWNASLAKHREMWREMLGLSPLPPRRL